jgi:hypothetical protein
MRSFVAVLTLVILTGCAHSRNRSDTFCDRGNGSPSRPLICVDESTFRTSPATTYVFDVERGTDGRRTEKPVVIHWFARRGGNLGVEFTDKSCVSEVTCDGRGHCRAVVKPLPDRKSKTCNYSLNLDGKASDPPIVVNPCCMFTPGILDVPPLLKE